MRRFATGTTNELSRFKVKLGAWLGWCVVVTSGCGLDDALVLPTTVTVGTGGNAGTGGTPSTPGHKPSPFCEFKWGRTWLGTSQDVLSTGKQAYPVGLGMTAIWIGYESDGTVNNAIKNMLVALSPGGDSTLQGVIPVFYGYFIPFQAANKDKIDKNCNPNATTPNICTDGAVWIWNNRDYLRSTYDNYVKQIASIWGTERPLIWLFEPGFNDYVRSSQSTPLTLTQLSTVASELIGTIKSRLPNALISHFASPLTTDLKQYFGALDLSLVDLVNVTGSAGYDYFYSGNTAQVNQQATYKSLHEATGLPLFVDTGFSASDVSKVTEPGWLTVGADVMNQRIADGVIGVQMDDGFDAMQTRINTITPELDKLDCGQ